MEPTTLYTSSKKRLRQLETWKSPFTEAQYTHFEKLKAQTKPINDMAVARELYHSWLWRDPRDRNQWLKGVLQSMAKKHGQSYCETIRSYMTKLKGEDHEIYSTRPADGNTTD
jgi:hypothetical protein